MVVVNPSPSIRALVPLKTKLANVFHGVREKPAPKKRKFVLDTRYPVKLI